ncbi:MAG: dTDP-4-dehydrorhamnose reductase [Rhodomicrobium sp.]
MSGGEILITGGSGQAGIELCRLPWPENLRLWVPGHSELDLSNPASVKKALDGRVLAAIVNAGAYTAVDRAESEPVVAFAVNALGPAALAEAARRMGAPLVHISTDYVFDGRKDGLYVEDDKVAPLGVYGASKEAGEQAVRTIHHRSAIVRTAWLVSPHHNNFLKTMLRLASERPALRVVADQIGCPTVALDLARALQIIVLRLICDPNAPVGTFHFVNAGETTWHGLATAVLARGAQQGHPVPPVEAISTAQYPTPAPRPANSRLSVAKLTKAYGIVPRPWPEAVAEAADALLEGRSSS